MSNSAAVPFRVEPQSTAVVVVDMQNDFCRVGAPLEVTESRETIPAIQSLIRSARAWSMPVVYTRFIAGPKPTPVWFYDKVIDPPTKFCWPGHKRYYPDVNKELTVIDVIDELMPEPGDYIVDKYGYSAFHNTILEDILRANHVNTIVICGTATNICCDSTARDAFHRMINMVMLSDGCSTFDEEAQRSTLKTLGSFFGRVMTTDEVIAELTAVRSPRTAS